MAKKGPDEDMEKKLRDIFAKKKAIAGVILIFVAAFGVSMAFTDAPSTITGYLIAEEEPEEYTVKETLVEDIEQSIAYHSENGDVEEEIEKWVEERLKEGHEKEELRKVLDEVGEDPGIVEGMQTEN